jgi:transcriptional regulator with GAF, ATPase, and Fis domain
MSLSSQNLTFDNRLLAIEEEFRQRKFSGALKDLEGLAESEFSGNSHEAGLYLLLTAEASLHEGRYRDALARGLQAARVLADFPLNRRYGRVQLVLSKAYSSIGDLKNAEIRARDALAAFRRAGENAGQIDSFNELARIAFVRCDYPSAADFLGEAIGMVVDNPRKKAQLTGNLGRIQTFTGEWNKARENLQAALVYAQENNQDISRAVNMLSLGYLEMRTRQFAEAHRLYEQAREIIDRLSLKREKVIYLEYTGELALEKGDLYRAKSMLSEAYKEGMMLASSSALVSQSARRLAEVELLLDNVEEAMKYGQKALDLSLQLGEKAEIGVSQRVIARVFVAKGHSEEALEYAASAVEVLGQVGDPCELGQALLTQAQISMELGDFDHNRVSGLFDRARRLFRKLDLEYWQAEIDFRSGVLSCQHGDLSTGFKRLSNAERVFSLVNDKVKLRAVSSFLRTLADQAVALSVSEENGFKIFGNLVTPDEYSRLRSSRIEDILEIVLRKTGGDRAVIYTPGNAEHRLASSVNMTTDDQQTFVDGFNKLLGEEFNRDRPTLTLDCRRDPFINALFDHDPSMVTSVVVVPFKMTDGAQCYLYVDRLARDNRLNPFSQAELNFAVGFSDFVAFKWAEIEKNRLLEDNRRLTRQLMEKSEFPNIITQNKAMLDLLVQVRQVVNSNISISITGETGSGKDLVAQAIHYNSTRRDKRFVSVNCAALPETLLESELFGYKRGAFTGADRDKSGLFEEADGGTFFLDEIGDMPLSIQAKILRVLEEKEIVRLGETRPRKVDVRIVSATNRDLKELMEEKLFRQDLYYRLSALTFRLPPLRERREDIPLLAAHFLKESGKRVSAEVLRRLMEYDWPGNVRELDNEIRKLALLAGESEEIGPELLSGKMATAAPGGGANGGNGSVQPVVAPEVEFDDDYSLYDYLSAHEKHFILRALKRKGGVKKHAAAMLNIPESTLRLKIKQYGIDLKNLDAIH